MIKTLFNITFVIITIAAFYITIDVLFELYSDMQIVFGFLALVIITILFFSLRLCFIKK